MKKVEQAHWESRFGIKIFDKEGVVTQPFEQEQWIIRRMTKFGWSRDNAQNEWNCEEAGNTRLDWLGNGRQMRLWLKKSEYADKGKEKSTT